MGSKNLGLLMRRQEGETDLNMLLRRTSLSPSFCIVFSTKPGDLGFSSGGSSSGSGANSSLKVGALRRGSPRGSRPCEWEDAVPFCPSRESFSCDCVSCPEGCSSCTGCVGSPAPPPPAAAALAMAGDGCAGALGDGRRAFDVRSIGEVKRLEDHGWQLNSAIGEVVQ